MLEEQLRGSDVIFKLEKEHQHYILIYQSFSLKIHFSLFPINKRN